MVDGAREARPVPGPELWAPFAARVSGLAAGLLGAIVIVGWHANLAALVQVHPAFVPMQYNTALGFLLAGVGLLSLSWGRRGIAALSAVAVLVLGLATLAQYVLAVDLGIDQLLMEHYITVETSHPGRMAPNTALSFVLVGGALLLLVGAEKRSRLLLPGGVVAAIVMFLGLVALAGYLSGAETLYGWGRLTRMAVHTAVGFMIVGAGGLSLAVARAAREAKGPELSALPVRVAVTGSVAALALVVGGALLAYQALHDLEAEANARSRNAEALLLLDSLYLMLVDAETGQRGFLLTGDSAYLEPYERAAPALRDLRLPALDLDEEDAMLGAVADRLEPLVAAKLQEIDSTVTLHAAGRAEEALALVRPGRGEVLMDEMRREIREASAALRELRERRDDVSAAQATRAETALLTGMGLAFLLLMGASGLAVWTQSHRMRAAVALSESERRFRGTFEQAAVGIALVAPDGRFLLLNERFAEIAGRSVEEMSALTFADITHPDDLDADLAYVEQVLEGEIDTYSMEKRYVKKDGGLVWVLLTVSLIRDGRGEPAYFVSVIQDISVLKERDDELERRAAELAAVNHELETFSYSVSHDLRQPLRGIDGFARILEEDFGDALDDEGRRVLGVVRENAQRMGVLIDELLHLSRLTRKRVEATRVAMGPLVEATLREIEPGPSVAIEIGPLPDALGDATLLRQVWQNYLGNALKYSSSEPQPRVEVTGKRDGDEVVYVVEDNGVGFDMQYADKLFGVFQRLHGEEFEGTGVGLATVQRIVHRHGGRAWAEGRPGDGATFFFSLPAPEAVTKEA